MKPRTDIHRPSVLTPADYNHLFVFAHPGQDEPFGVNLEQLRAIPHAELARPSAGRHQCHVCGAVFRYGSVFLHTPTGKFLVTGWECAEKLDSLTDFEAAHGEVFSELRRLRDRAIRRSNLRAWVAETPAEVRKALRTKHPIVQDIRRRVIQWGNLTDGQTALVLKLAAEARDKAARPAEVLVPAPVTGQRQTIRGVVVSIKTHESAYGPSEKITVKVTTPDGVWLAWGTAPTALLEEAAGNGGIKGCTVEFDAVLKAGREPHFALFSRPTKARVVEFREVSD